MNVFFAVGYLGSGKTTFLKSFLSAHKHQKNAVLVNDFGDLDVDGKLLENESERLETITGGSIFCSCRSDKFAEALLKLAALNLDNILVEASGLANPFSLRDIIEGVKGKADAQLKICGTVCLVDCTSFEKVLGIVNMVKMQVACADLVLLNKSDLCSKEDVARIQDTVRLINPFAKIEVTSRSKPQSFEIEITKKVLPSHVADLVLQKAVINISDCSVIQVDEFCKKAMEFCHRIKGIIKINGSFYVYQFDNGSSEITKTHHSERQYLVCLACNGKNLKTQLKTITDHKFLLQEDK